MDVETSHWTRDERSLWQRIARHAFEDSTITLDFMRRLARTLGWTLETARAGIDEYRRFCFLAIVTPGAPVTPSEEIDEIWHLHLTYTRDYWDRWCGVALGQKLHHDPTVGGPIERRRFHAQYADTLALYERYFGQPPATFWPQTAKRFGPRPRYRVVDSDLALVIRRPSLRPLRRAKVFALAGFLAALGTPTKAALANPLDLPGPDFLGFFGVSLGVAAIVTLILRTLLRATGRPTDFHGISAIQTAYIKDGMARAADTLFLDLATRGVASHDAGAVTIGQSSGNLSGELAGFRAALQGTRPRKTFIADFKTCAPTKAMLDALERRNVILGGVRRRLLGLATGLPLALVLSLGIAKICVGLSRGRPVGILTVMVAGVGAALVVTIARERGLTSEGKDALAAMRSRLDRAVRAPRAEEIAIAFALGGAAALAGTDHEAYAKVVQASPSGTDSSGGDGDGGGGCGGCGS